MWLYNYGPDYNVLSSRSSRPIQRLKIERQPGVDLSAAARSGALTKVQGDRLVVAAPARISKPAPGIAPPRMKTKGGAAENRKRLDRRCQCGAVKAENSNRESEEHSTADWRSRDGPGPRRNFLQRLPNWHYFAWGNGSGYGT